MAEGCDHLIITGGGGSRIQRVLIQVEGAGEEGSVSCGTD